MNKQAPQQTIKYGISFSGVGLHCGNAINAKLLPSEEDTGIVFERTDLPEGENLISFNWQNVNASPLSTNVKNEFGAEVSTVEHLMFALWCCKVDNIRIRLDGPEVPIMDGSAKDFIFLLESVGFINQASARKRMRITNEVKAELPNGSFVKIKPSDSFKISFVGNYSESSIGEQRFSFSENDSPAKTNISLAKTFCQEKDIEYMRSIGKIKGGSLANAIVASKEGIINKENMSYEDEFARHKILDSIADFSVCAMEIEAEIECFKSGHMLHNMLVREIFSNSSNYIFL